MPHSYRGTPIHPGEQVIHRKIVDSIQITATTIMVIKLEAVDPTTMQINMTANVTVEVVIIINSLLMVDMTDTTMIRTNIIMNNNIITLLRIHILTSQVKLV